jgi:VanZ family protein
LWLAVVAVFSSKAFGFQNTGSVLSTVLGWLHLKLSPAGLYALHYGIRKGAHFFAYGVLSALFFRAVRGPLPEALWRVSWALTALAICFVTASSDEIHQLYTPGRGGTYRDVLLDMAGALFAQLVILIVYLGKTRPEAHPKRP